MFDAAGLEAVTIVKSRKPCQLSNIWRWLPDESHSVLSELRCSVDEQPNTFGRVTYGITSNPSLGRHLYEIALTGHEIAYFEDNLLSCSRESKRQTVGSHLPMPSITPALWGLEVYGLKNTDECADIA